MAATSQTANGEQSQLDIDLERQKLALEKEKLRLEVTKARWNASAIAVPILAAVATAWFGLYSQNEQAKSQFEIKAAEIVLQAKSPEEASDKARALKALFPNRLPVPFAESFDPTKFAAYSQDIISEKLELLKMLDGKNGNRKREIVVLWTKLFPDDKAGPAILADLRTSAK